MAAVWPIVRGFFWPLGNIAFLLTQPLVKENDGHVKDGKKVSAAQAFASSPVAFTFSEHLAVQVSTWQKLIIAAIIWAYFVDLEGARRGDLAWLSTIILRDLAITYYHAGLQDFMGSSAFSPFSRALKAYKYNPQPPRDAQMLWDMGWSTLSTVISSLFEAWALRGWVTGSLALPAGCVPGDAWYTSPATWLLLLSMPYWRLSHFFLCVRGQGAGRWGAGASPTPPCQQEPHPPPSPHTLTHPAPPSQPAPLHAQVVPGRQGRREALL